MAATQDLVPDFSPSVGVANNYLLAFHDHNPVQRPGIVGCPPPTPAQRLDLKDLHAIGQFNKPRATGEECRSKVGRDTEGEDIDG